jgi:hypothetical protein
MSSSRTDRTIELLSMLMCADASRSVVAKNRARSSAADGFSGNSASWMTSRSISRPSVFV